MTEFLKLQNVKLSIEGKMIPTCANSSTNAYLGFNSKTFECKEHVYNAYNMGIPSKHSGGKVLIVQSDVLFQWKWHI